MITNRIRIDTWIAICATLIAIVGISLSIWSAVQQREHNRLSVKPIISFSFSVSEEGTGWWLLNQGLGPAHIVWFEARVDDKPQQNWDNLFLSLGIRPAHYKFGVPTGGYYLPSTQTNVVSIKDIKDAKILKNERKRVELRACFCSMYEECWIVGNKIRITANQCQQDVVKSLSMSPDW